MWIPRCKVVVGLGKICPSVGSNYKLRAWRGGWGCGNPDQGPGSRMVGPVVWRQSLGWKTALDSYRHTSLCCTLLYCISQVLLFFSLFFFFNKLKVCQPTLLAASLSAPCFQQHLLTSCLCHILIILAVFKPSAAKMMTSLKAQIMVSIFFLLAKRCII